MQTWSASVFRAYFLSLTAPVEMATEHINRAGLMEKFKDLEIEPVITEHPEVGHNISLLQLPNTVKQ